MIDFTNKALFKNTSGARLTRGLFYECYEDSSQAVYTLKTRDHPVGDKIYLSLYLLYMAEEDPTEFVFAEKYLVDHEHWLMISTGVWFKPHLEKWRRELDLKIKSQALKRIINTAKLGGRDALQANRYLIEKGWENKQTTYSRGRPSKDEIKKEARRLSEEETRLTEDFNRLNTNNVYPLITVGN